MEDFWCVKSIILTSNELFLIQKMKATEKIKLKRVQELYKLLLKYNLIERIYWETIDDINKLEEEIERSKKVRRALEGR